MRECNECGNKACHKIHAPRVEYVLNKATNEEHLKPLELRLKHRLSARMMGQSCRDYKPIYRKGTTILEQLIYNSPVEVQKLLDITKMMIIDVTYPPYFRVVPIRTRGTRRFKKRKKVA